MNVKPTKEREEQRRRIADAMTILEPLMSDPQVSQSVKSRLRFILDVSQPTHNLKFRETPIDGIDRRMDMIGGWPYCSDKHPWRKVQGKV